jgi:hypothetical protein
LGEVIAHDVDGIVSPLCCELRYRAPGILRQVRRDRDLHAVPRRDAPPVIEAVPLDVRADALAGLLAWQALEHRFQAPCLHPLRHEIFQGIAAGRVRIRIAIDGKPAPLRRFDAFERSRRLAPVVQARAFEVDDLDVDAAGLRDVDRFVHRFEDLVRLVAKVREVARVVALEHLAQRNHLLARGVSAG